jgi:hypothetical protein
VKLERKLLKQQLQGKMLFQQIHWIRSQEQIFQKMLIELLKNSPTAIGNSEKKD